MTVSVNTAAAGAINSSIGVNFVSGGAVNGVSNGLGTLGVGSANYGVSGTIQANVIDQARPVINGVANPGAVTVDLGNVRINTAASQNLIGAQPGHRQSAGGAERQHRQQRRTGTGQRQLQSAGAGRDDREPVGRHRYVGRRRARGQCHGQPRVRRQQHRQLRAELPAQPAEPDRQRQRQRLSAGQSGAEHRHGDRRRARGRCGRRQSGGVDHQRFARRLHGRAARQPRRRQRQCAAQRRRRSPIWPRRAPTVRRSRWG